MSSTLTAMTLKPTLSFEQYKDACFAVAAAKQKNIAARTWKYYVCLAAVCLSVGLTPQVPQARPLALGICIVWTLFLVFSKPVAKRRLLRCMRIHFAEEEERLNRQVLTIHEDGIRCDACDGQTTAHYTWAAFTKRIDVPDAYLFLPSPNSFVRVPKETLSLADREDLWAWSSLVPVFLQN